jgi:hypothetical protein
MPRFYHIYGPFSDLNDAVLIGLGSLAEEQKKEKDQGMGDLTGEIINEELS